MKFSKLILLSTAALILGGCTDNALTSEDLNLKGKTFFGDKMSGEYAGLDNIAVNFSYIFNENTGTFHSNKRYTDLVKSGETVTARGTNEPFDLNFTYTQSGTKLTLSYASLPSDIRYLPTVIEIVNHGEIKGDFHWSAFTGTTTFVYR